MPSDNAEQNARRLCTSLTADVEPLEEQHRRAEWEAESAGNESAFAALETYHAKVMTRLADKSDFAMAEALLGAGHELEPLTRREVFRWRNRLARQQVDQPTIEKLAAAETGLVQQFNSFRANLNGTTVTDNEIDRILSESTDSDAVEAAWKSSKQIADYCEPGGGARPVAQQLLDLVKLRNRAAEQIGYSNAYRAHLELGELDQDWLYDILRMLDAETAPLFAEYKESLDMRLADRFAMTVKELRPWHYGDRFFQSPPEIDVDDDLDRWFKNKDISELTVRSFDALGFDIRPIVGRSDLFPGDPATSKKCQHAFCTTIVAPGDVRVLCNIIPGKRWMSTNLHEFGHAIYGSSLDPKLAYVLRDDPHTLTNEAIAMLMQRHLIDAGWLERIAGIPGPDAERLAQTGRRQLAISHLVFTRWVLVMCHFERALYEDPDRPDIASYWWDLVEHFQQVVRPSAGRTNHDWAAKIHFVGYPAYYQNYLLGEVFGAQLEHAIERECGPFVGNPKAGEFLRQRMFREGAKFPWQELLERMTGEPLNPKYFLAALEYSRN